MALWRFVLPLALVTGSVLPYCVAATPAPATTTPPPPDPHAGCVLTVIRATLGGSASLYAKPAALDTAYGHNPKSFTLFAKLALGQ